MKKYLSKIGIFLVLTCFLLNSTLVLAANPETGSRQGKGADSGQTAADNYQSGAAAQGAGHGQAGINASGEKSKGQIFKERIQERKQSYQQIREQRTELVRLQTELRAVHSQIVRKINELRQQKEPLNEKQINQLKECLRTMKTDNKEIRDDLGGIQREVVRLRVNQNNQEHEQTMEGLQAIIANQEDRIEMLKKAVTDLKKILTV